MLRRRLASLDHAGNTFPRRWVFQMSVFLNATACSHVSIAAAMAALCRPCGGHRQKFQVWGLTQTRLSASALSVGSMVYRLKRLVHSLRLDWLSRPEGLTPESHSQSPAAADSRIGHEIWMMRTCAATSCLPDRSLTTGLVVCDPGMVVMTLPLLKAKEELPAELSIKTHSLLFRHVGNGWQAARLPMRQWQCPDIYLSRGPSDNRSKTSPF